MACGVILGARAQDSLLRRFPRRGLRAALTQLVGASAVVTCHFFQRPDRLGIRCEFRNPLIAVRGAAQVGRVIPDHDHVPKWIEESGLTRAAAAGSSGTAAPRTGALSVDERANHSQGVVGVVADQDRRPVPMRRRLSKG
jgi:hypothetical protein